MAAPTAAPMSRRAILLLLLLPLVCLIVTITKTGHAAATLDADTQQLPAVIKFIGIQHGHPNEQVAKASLAKSLNMITGQNVEIDEFNMRDGGIIVWHSNELRDCNEPDMRQLLAKIKNPDSGAYTRDFKMFIGPEFSHPLRVEAEWRGRCENLGRKRTISTDVTSDANLQKTPEGAPEATQTTPTTATTTTTSTTTTPDATTLPASNNSTASDVAAFAPVTFAPTTTTSSASSSMPEDLNQPITTIVPPQTIPDGFLETTISSKLDDEPASLAPLTITEPTPFPYEIEDVASMIGKSGDDTAATTTTVAPSTETSSSGGNSTEPDTITTGDSNATNSDNSTISSFGPMSLSPDSSTSGSGSGSGNSSSDSLFDTNFSLFDSASTSTSTSSSDDLIASTTTTTTTTTPTTTTTSSNSDLDATEPIVSPDFAPDASSSPSANLSDPSSSSSSASPPHYGKYIGLTTGFFVFIAYLLCARAYRRQGMYELQEST